MFFLCIVSSPLLKYAFRYAFGNTTRLEKCIGTQWHDFKLHCLVTITLESDIKILVTSTRPICIYRVYMYMHIFIAIFKQRLNILNSIHCWVCATGSEEGSEVKSFK